MPSFWYDEHYEECSLNQDNGEIAIPPVILHVPLDPTQKPALAYPRQLQLQRAEQIAANKRARRRRNLARRRAGTTIRPEKSQFTGGIRPGREKLSTLSVCHFVSLALA